MWPVSTSTFRAQPWEVGDSERPALLRWFLDADLSDPAAIARLLELTGRESWRIRSTAENAEAAKLIAELIAAGKAASEAELVYHGRETGQWKIHQVVTRATFTQQYRNLQRYLSEAQAYWQRAKNEDNREQRELLAALALHRINEERADVTPLEVDRDPVDGHVLWPERSTNPEPVRRSTSLAGELAMALYDEMRGAQRAGICKVCHRPWLSPLRKDRQLCGRPECLRSWRNAHRKPEDPAKVYERVKRARARRARKGQSK